MATVKDTIWNLAQRNGVYITELIKVKEEDAETADSVKHMCRGGFSQLQRQHVEMTIPVQKANGVVPKPLAFDLWNCKHCGKSYFYHYNTETASIY